MTARWLGYAGLAPQILFADIIIAGPRTLGPAAAQIALAYAGTILSFIGGVWWGIASRAQAKVHFSVWIAAVVPSLIGFACIGAPVIGVSYSLALFVAAISLVASLGMDYKLATGGLSPSGWIGLRTPLSLGLGGLTILIAILS